MGIVFRGVHVSTGALVAIKTVRAPTSQHLTALRREIHALSRLQHPGVVRIVDHGVEHGLPWYAMELLVGTTLADLLTSRPSSTGLASTLYSRVAAQMGGTRTQPANLDAATNQLYEGLDSGVQHHRLPLAVLVRVFTSVCETLAHLHESGFVHRDLKPSNIFIDEDGNTLLVDFGVAAHFAGAGGKEKVDLVGAVAGSAAYMSPEQIRGDLVDARSDLYSLGCVLCECVTGSPPFTGSTAWDVLNSQLWDEPEALTKREPSVPPALDALVIRLLAKRPQDRIGYADVVAKALAALTPGSQAPSAKRAPSYLYRPSFVRRHDLQAKFGDLLDNLQSGVGAVLLLSGESGVGKTRSAMELAALAQRRQVTVAVGECSPLGLDTSYDRVLAPFRPVLQAIADACREGGSSAATELIGPHGKILARIEPAFMGLPSSERTGPLDSSAKVSVRQVLTVLRDTIMSFARRQPVLVVLDDLQWADDLSLGLVAELAGCDTRATPLLVLGTYRSEEVSGQLQELIDSGKVPCHAVARLARPQVGAMIAGMLALETVPADLLDYVDERAEGNPFLVSEYLMAEIESGTLRREEIGDWTLQRAALRERLSEPPSLPDRVRSIFLQRFGKLDQATRRLASVAAVFGRDVSAISLQILAGVDDDVMIEGLQTLRRQQIFDDTHSGQLRFRHDQLRLCMYEAIDADERRSLHEQAGELLERHAEEQSRKGRNETLAYHFSQAQRPERAHPYFSKAGDEARAAWANRDALRYYEAAVGEARKAAAASPDLRAQWREATTLQLEAIGDLESLTSRREAARAAYDSALSQLAVDRRAERARLQRKLGKTWETQHSHDEALRCYDVALEWLGPEAPIEHPEEREEWIQVHVEKLWVYYWQNQVAAMDEALGRVRPLIEKFATPLQRARTYQTQMLVGFRRDRYLVSEETLRYARRAVEACREGNEVQELPAAQMAHGLALLVQGSLETSNAELASVLEFSQRAGDNALQARCLTYLAMCARMRRRMDEAREYTRRTAQTATVSGMVEYLAAADANDAWLCLREGDPSSCRALAQRALVGWRQRVYPFQWMALLPLLECELRAGNVAEAIVCAEGLLAPTQQYLPGSAADALARAIKHWQDQDSGGAQDALSSGLTSLASTGYW